MNDRSEDSGGQAGSSERQLLLTNDRGQLFALLQRVRLGGPSHKAFVFALALHPEGWQGRPVSYIYRELARSIDVGIKSAYRIGQKLDALGVIIRVHERWKPPVFHICWPNLWALDEEQSGVPTMPDLDDAISRRSEQLEF
jgi:hypothetical protein